MGKQWTSGEKVMATDLNKVVTLAGMVTPYAGSSAPSGWLLCDGSAVSRSSYADLFAVVGTTFGAGDGSTTFNLPNLKGKVPVGHNAAESEFDSLGESGGEKTHTLTISEMPSHTHQLGGGSGSESYHAVNSSPAYYPGIATLPSGSGLAHNNLQPYIVLNYIIKT